MPRIMKKLAQKFSSVVIATSLFLISPATLHASDHSKSTIAMQGQASIAAAPDRAEINIGVRSKAPTARDALNLNNVNMKSVFATLKASGVKDKHIGTSNFSVQPDYERYRDGRAPKIRGYSVTNSVRIHLEDIEKLGQILDKVVSSGSNQINGIRFFVSNADELKDEARKLAIKNAQRKANIYTSAAGVKLGKIISIAEGVHGGPQPRPMAKALRAEASSVPIARGEQQLVVNVSVVWALD